MSVPAPETERSPVAVIDLATARLTADLRTVMPAEERAVLAETFRRIGDAAAFRADFRGWCAIHWPTADPAQLDQFADRATAAAATLCGASS